jgi:hypothetical protein
MDLRSDLNRGYSDAVLTGDGWRNGNGPVVWEAIFNHEILKRQPSEKMVNVVAYLFIEAVRVKSETRGSRGRLSAIGGVATKLKG